MNKRMKRKEVSAEVWIAHRKERKKIASAKWYAAKKKAEIKEQNRKRRELEEELQAKKKTYLWTHEERASWRCALDHVLRGWPCRPPHVKATTWCRLMDITQECVDRMYIDWSKRPDEQLCLVRQMCMRELMQSYPREGGEEESTDEWLAKIRERIHRRSSGEAHHSTDSISSQSAWERVASTLTEGWFPFVCTGVGLLFLQLATLGQLRHWPGLVRHMAAYEATSNTTTVQQRGDSPPHTNPPNQNPMQNPCLNDEGIQRLMAELTRLSEGQQEQEQEHVDDDILVVPWEEEYENDYDHHSSYFSCSLPSSLDSLLLPSEAPEPQSSPKSTHTHTQDDSHLES